MVCHNYINSADALAEAKKPSRGSEQLAQGALALVSFSAAYRNPP